VVTGLDYPPAALLALTRPIPPGIRRGAARHLARRELARSIYKPSIWHRIVAAITRWLSSALGPVGPGHAGWWTVALIVVAVVVIGGVIAWLGPVRRTGRRRTSAVLAGTQLSAADHRRNAERLAAGEQFGAAIVERVRAIAVELESRGVLLPRPGRTASELAAEAAGALPGVATGLQHAARLFDDVRYGGRAGTAPGYEQVRDLDASIAAMRTAVVAAAGPGGPRGAGGLGGPRGTGSPGGPA
jgi:hypothetical protein